MPDHASRADYRLKTTDSPAGDDQQDDIIDDDDDITMI